MELKNSFFGINADELAPRLLGKLLCRRTPEGEVIRLRINETEAYMGCDDSACHASRGRTARTETLYCRGGTVYVYLCYGIHYMLNIVSGSEGDPQAVLIRGAGALDGPGKLTRALKITKDLNRCELGEDAGLWIEDDGYSCGYTATPRIGIAYAEQKDIDRLWRFVAL